MSLSYRARYGEKKAATVKKTKTAEAASRVVTVAEKQSVDALKHQTMKRQLKASTVLWGATLRRILTRCDRHCGWGFTVRAGSAEKLLV